MLKLVSFQEIELELCIMDLQNYIVSNSTLFDDEKVGYWLSDDMEDVEFLIVVGCENNEKVFTGQTKFLLSYNFEESTGEAAEDIDLYMSKRALMEIEYRLMRLSSLMNE